MLMPESQLVIFDLEFTDDSERTALTDVAEIVEIGAVKVDRAMRVTDTFTTLVRPTKMERWSEQCQRLTGIQPEDLADAPPFAAVWKGFAEFTRYRNLRLCSWNIVKDYEVLAAAYVGEKLGFPHSLMPVDAFSLFWAACLRDQRKVKGAGLDAACEAYGVPIWKSRHRALPDALGLAALISKLFAEGETHSEPFTLIEV